LTPTIDSLLEESQERFGLIPMISGFSRTKSNYGKEIAKGFGIAALTMGMY